MKSIDINLKDENVEQFFIDILLFMKKENMPSDSIKIGEYNIEDYYKEKILKKEIQTNE